MLLVRAWIEPGESSVVRARLFTTEDDSPVPTTWATAAGDDAICAELLRWLHHLRRHRAGGTDRSTSTPPDQQTGTTDP